MDAVNTCPSTVAILSSNVLIYVSVKDRPIKYVFHSLGMFKKWSKNAQSCHFRGVIRIYIHIYITGGVVGISRSSNPEALDVVAAVMLSHGSFADWLRLVPSPLRLTIYWNELKQTCENDIPSITLCVPLKILSRSQSIRHLFLAYLICGR